MKKTVLALTCAVLCAAPALAEEAKKPYRSTDDIIASAPADAWRSVDPANLLYMQLDKGTVIYELAPDFAPEHVAQIRMLAQKHFWDGLSIYRVQDNYVTQFGDPNVDTDKQKPLPAETKKLPAEFERPTFIFSDTGIAIAVLADKVAITFRRARKGLNLHMLST